MPAAEPSSEGVGADHLTQRGFEGWVDRTLALACLGTILPAIFLAQDELLSLHPAWLGVVGGGLLGVALLMPRYAWSSRGVRGLAGAYALLVLLGLLAWPLAWRSPGAALSPPFLWVCVGLAIVSVAVALSIPMAAVYSVVVAAVLLVVRLTPSGGGVEVLQAGQDVLWAVGQPASLLLALGYLRSAVAALDDSRAASDSARAEAALEEALAVERARLDAIVHDEVMTTLVAAAHRAALPGAHLAGQAQHALDSLAVAESSADDDRPVTGDHLARLVVDVVRSVAPLATVTADVAPGLTVPNDVGRALTQAVREAALNAGRHARADHVEVRLVATASGPDVDVRATVADDGTGFVVDHIAPERHGIRLSLRERMHVVGGRAAVRSAPGAGTTVELTWTGSGAGVPTPGSSPSLADHPLLRRLDARPMRALAVAVLGLHLVLGATSAPQTARPAVVAVALAIVLAAATVGLAGRRWEVPPARGALLVASTLVAGLLSVWAMPAGSWPAHSTWFSGAGTVLLVVVAVRSREWLAWAGALALAVLVLVAAPLTGGTLPQALSIGLLPIAWLTLLGFLLRWLESLSVQLLEAEQSSGDAAALRAALFSKLVLREVWLTDLRARVGPLLARLADADLVLDDDLRTSCLVTEASLRDSLRAGNLTSPSLSAAIVDARRRGVAVTLVDNRGDRLPDPVLRATLAALETTVRDATEGRIVARTAPAGYDAAVTIVQTGPRGDARLTSIDESGAAVVSTP